MPQGFLIVNADDWGRDPHTTLQILDCVLRKTVSSASAMVFMEDSKRAAGIAREREVDVGLHLNFTTPFSGPQIPTRLMEHQQRVSRYLRSHRLAPVVYNPGLTNAFEYVVAAQIDEFSRLYGERPGRIDGHHHMHLCSNVIFRNLLPLGSVVRRNFTFGRGEKGLCNRAYRRFVDRILRRRHELSDFFFSLAPLEPAERLRRVFSLARRSTVEVETHPVNPDEYRFLTEGALLSLTDVTIAPCFAVQRRVFA